MTSADLTKTTGQNALVVIDGCDGTGKTTLARRISARYGHRVIHASLSAVGTDLFAKYDAMINSPVPLVFDRSFVSELVYGPLERGSSRLSLDQAAQLAATVAERQGVLVHLTGQPERINERLRARDGRAPAQAHISALIAAYADAFGQLAEHAIVLTELPRQLWRPFLAGC
jgi:thymidylate kinase